MFTVFKKMFGGKEKPENGAKDSLDAFLKGHNCTGCRNRCPLNRTRCGGGLKEKREMTKLYENKIVEEK